MLENILFIVSQVLTVVILPAVKWWLDKGNKQLVEQIENLNKEVKKTQNQVDEVTQIGLHNRDSNKSIMSYRLHKEFSEAIERGYTTSEDLSELSGLYKSYQEIGGNGKIETLFNRFKTLPIHK